MTRRVLAIGLDGYEPHLGERLMKADRLPALATLRRRSARFTLNHGNAVGTGLAWEHFTTGRAPENSGVWSSVVFDPATYDVWQAMAPATPFAARLPVRTVVLDVPYFMLPLAPNAQGAVGWNAYDPGVAPTANPPGLIDELQRRFASHGDRAILNLSPWNSPKLTMQLGNNLVEFLENRRRATLWLLRERLPGWDFAMTVTSELHAAIEALWYGVDREHALHDKAPARAEAARALVAGYEAIDRFVGSLMEAFPDANIVAFSLNGMGGNSSDTASMALLGELLYRHAFGEAWLRDDETATAGGIPMLGETESWGAMMRRRMPPPPGFASFARRDAADRLSLDWMPVSRLRPFWSRMPAFALPSFYDGKVRLNLAGREAQGVVALADYDSVIADIVALLQGCTDPVTGRDAVRQFQCPTMRDPLSLAPTDADLTVIWNSPALGLEHPQHGRIGPLPFRRCAGHLTRGGIAWIDGAGLPAGHFGVRSSFDVAPTIVELLGQPPLDGIDGTSLLAGPQIRDARASTAHEPAAAPAA